MAITRTTMIDDDGSGTTGTILNNAWLQTIYDQIDASVVGPWVDVPYSAANFTVGGTGTWTMASHQTYAYQVSGKTLTLAFYASGTTVTGTPQSLNLKVPGGYAIGRQQGGVCAYLISPSTPGLGWALLEPAGTVIKIHRDVLGTLWPAGGVYLTANFVFNVA